MSKQPETLFKEKVKRDLRDLLRAGYPVFEEKIQQIAIRGTPDHFLVIAGWPIGLELKRNAHEQPDALQNHKLVQIIVAGGISLRACPENWPWVLELIHRLIAPARQRLELSLTERFELLRQSRTRSQSSASGRLSE